MAAEAADPVSKKTATDDADLIQFNAAVDGTDYADRRLCLICDAKQRTGAHIVEPVPCNIEYKGRAL